MAEAVRRSKERDGVRVCLLIHDLLPATSQRWFADAQGRAAKDDIDTLIAAADAIFTVSAEVATELETLYGKRATLLRPADPQLNHAHENAPVDLPFAERTILSVGTFHPRKNLAALVRIWDAWRDAPTLVLVGRRALVVVLRDRDEELRLGLGRLQMRAVRLIGHETASVERGCYPDRSEEASCRERV